MNYLLYFPCCMFHYIFLFEKFLMYYLIYSFLLHNYFYFYDIMYFLFHLYFHYSLKYLITVLNQHNLTHCLFQIMDYFLLYLMPNFHHIYFLFHHHQNLHLDHIYLLFHHHFHLVSLQLPICVFLYSILYLIFLYIYPMNPVLLHLHLFHLDHATMVSHLF